MPSTDVSSYDSVREIDTAILIFEDQIDRFYRKRGLLLGLGLPCLLGGIALIIVGAFAAALFSLFIFVAYIGVFAMEAGILLLILRSALFNRRIRNRKLLIRKLDIRRRDLLEAERNATPIVSLQKEPKPASIRLEKEPEPHLEEDKPAVIELEKEPEPLLEDRPVVINLEKGEEKSAVIHLEKEEASSQKKTSSDFHYAKGEGE